MREQPVPAVDGLLLVDKPAGPTSHDIVARVRRTLRQRRVGHGGTLDPFATGLLVVALGRATRLSRWLTGSDKTYEGRVQFGWTTDTLDPTGALVGMRTEAEVTRAALDEALARLTGEIDQCPPMYSAKKIDGVALHRRARRGEEVERATVRIRIDGWEVLEAAPDALHFRVKCSAGTYVRVLAADLGALVGCPAHLAALRRTASGPFRAEDAISLEDLLELERDGALARVISLDDVPALLPPLVLADGAEVRAFLHGRALAAEGEDDADLWVRDPEGRLLGVGRREKALLRPLVVLSDPA